MRARNAPAWGKEHGAIAINVSAEVRLDNGFKASPTKGADGNWYSTHWYYGQNGYNGAKSKQVIGKNPLGNEMVLVKALVTQGTDYSVGMNPNGNCY